MLNNLRRWWYFGVPNLSPYILALLYLVSFLLVWALR